MTSMNWKQVSRAHYPQVVFVCAAFFLMVLIGCLSVSGVIQRETSSTVSVALRESEKAIKAYLREPRIAFNHIYVTLQDMLDRGESQQAVYDFLARAGESLYNQEEDIQGFNGVHGFIRGEFLSSIALDPDIPFVPQQRPWYQLAIRSREAAYTAPYEDLHTGKTVIALAREIYGQSGEYYGVLSLEVDLSWVIDYVRSLALTEGGYGMIVNQDLDLLAHPNEEFTNRQLRELGPDYEEVSAMLRRGEEVSAKRLAGTEGSSEIVFFRELYNGWHIGVAMPAGSYYADLYMTAAILISLGLVLALVLSYLLLRLSAAKMQSDEESRSKSSFLAVMSHEIRTPLNAILGLSEIQMHNPLPEGTKEDLSKIYTSGSNLLRIINDILDLSKIEAGSLELVPVDYELPSLINDTVQLNIVRIGDKPVAFSLELDENLPLALCGDEIRVKQVLNNLLSNAFKYTRQGRVVLDIRWQPLPDGDGRLIFEVSDTGIGIKKEDMKRLFTEYSQIDRQANRKIEGTGLGLTITRQLAERMSGAITVDSEYGKGSVFTVSLRQGVADARPMGRELVESLKGFRLAGGRSVRKSHFVRAYMPYARVLVVDDIPTNLDVTRGLLLPYGMTVETVISGREAVELVRSNERYDAIFMDHMMPDMDGVEATRLIRELDSDYARTVPIIALTANALAGNEEMFLACGFSAFISKPIDVVRLDSLIRFWIQSPRADDVPSPVEESAAQATEYPDDWPEFEAAWAKSPVNGIELNTAIRRYDSADAYLQVLRSYARHTPGLLHLLCFESDRNLAAYAVHVHGLKGSSLSIGATAVSRLAAEMEHAAKSGDAQAVLAGNSSLIARAEDLLAGLNAFFAVLEQPGDKPFRDHPDLLLLARLEAAAADFDISAMETVLAELEAFSYKHAADAELIVWLRHQTDSLEYDALRQRLERELKDSAGTKR